MLIKKEIKPTNAPQKCSSCDKSIEKGEIRIANPSGCWGKHLSWEYYHKNCFRNRINKILGEKDIIFK